MDIAGWLEQTRSAADERSIGLRMNRSREWRAFLILVITAVVVVVLANGSAFEINSGAAGESPSVQTAVASSPAGGQITQEIGQFDNDVAASAEFIARVDEDMQGRDGK